MNWLRGEKRPNTDLRPSKFWEYMLYDVYTTKIKRDLCHRTKINSVLHKNSAIDSVIWFMYHHTNVYLVTDFMRTIDIGSKHPDISGRIYSGDEFKEKFTKNKYYNPDSPSERKGSGRFTSDMFIFVDYELNKNVMNQSGIYRVLSIEIR